MGSTTPRIYTPPLRKLTPWSSYGFAVIRFAARVLGAPLDPWQQWLAIHLGELLPDGRPRFRQVLVLVARQQGKTHLAMVLTLFWLFVERHPLTFGTSTSLEQAGEPWEAACLMAESTPALAAQLPRNAIRKANGQQALRTVHRSAYKIGAVSPRGGRGKTIDRIVGDELREHRSWVGYRAAYNAMNAVPGGQAVYITNQGDDASVVLNALYASALEFVDWWAEHGDPGVAESLLAGDIDAVADHDARLGLFEWSAPDGAHPMDMSGWAAAMPNLGRRTDHATVRGAAIRVSKPGADPGELAGFLTEMLCQRVKSMNAALDMLAFARCEDPGTLDPGEISGRLVACVDVAPDGAHVTLAAAAVLEDGRVRVEVVQSWDDATEAAAGVARWAAANRPYVLGWFPGGPAAAIDANLRDRRRTTGRAAWPPRGVKVSEIQGETPAAVCMGFGQLVRSRLIAHSGQDLLVEHAGNAERRNRGEGGGWVFDRRAGGGHVDALYAAAGAVHLARTAPAPRPRSRMHVVPS